MNYWNGSYMAYSNEQWERAKAYYEAGLSLSKIKDKTGIARNTISQRAKKEQWEHSANADYIEAKEVIAVKKGTISEQAVLVLDEVADENIRRKNLVYGNAEKLASKLTTMIDQIDTPNDALTIANANDRLAITMKVADRHAPKIDIQQLQQQNTTGTTTVNIVEDKVVND